MERKTVRLLTFNTWGLKFVSKFRKERLQAIANKLAQEEYDVVALQEVWVEEDWLYIDRICRDKYPYRRCFSAGIIAGPGLAILLKIPITSTFLYRFPINGRPSAFFRGDWFVGKSIAVTVLDSGASGTPPIAILNSHMHAPYAQTGDAAYSTHRACQAWDLAKIVKTLQRAGYAVVQVGDLNSKPGSLPYKLFTLEGGLADSWEVLHGANTVLNDQIALMDPEDQVREGGITCDSRLNTWRAHRQPWEACRLDYALIDSRMIQPVLAGVTFTDLLPSPFSCSFSDHFAYSVELAIGNVENLETKPDDAAMLALYKATAEEIQYYLDHTIPAQARWRKLHFFGSIVAVVAIQVGIIFAAIVVPWAAILLSLGSTIIGVSGVLNGLIWYLGVRSEQRALQEVKLEVEDAMRAISPPKCTRAAV